MPPTSHAAGHLESDPNRLEAPGVLDLAHGLIRVRTAWLVTLADPLSVDIWRDGTVTATDVADSACAVATGQCSVHEHTAWMADPLERTPCRRCDIAKIRWFMQHGTDDIDPHPITVDVGIGPFVPDWILVDGNHRVAAAVIASVPTLVVQVVGDVDRGVRLLVDEVDDDGLFFMP